MRLLAAIPLLLSIGWSLAAGGRYLGKEVGQLSQLHHAVRGRVYAVDSRTLFLTDFHYDGEGPAAYFYVGTSKTVNAAGATRLRDERGSGAPLRRYRGESITLSLPDGKTLKDVAWFAVWCDEFSVNFGSVDIPRTLEYPKPAKVGALRGVHGVSSDPIVVVDAQTLLVPNFSYDGEAPDAKFWVGRGEKPSPQGIRIPDENGKEAPLRKYDRKTVVLTLPGELTVFDIGHFAVWCEAFTVNFGHVTLPSSALRNVPPSLKMLGVSPQSRNKALSGETTRAPSRPRKPLARLDATTYRPPRLLAGPPAPAEQPTSHAQHRRADDYTPNRDQLINQPSSNQLDHKPLSTESPEAPKEKDFEIQKSEELEHLSQHTSGGLIVDDDEQNRPEHERFVEQGGRSFIDSQYRAQNIHNPLLYQQQNQFYQQNVQHREPLSRSTEELLYQQQLYEQQRRILERQLQQYQPFIPQPDPLRYRLNPYNFEQYPDGQRSRRQVDLDLIAGSGPQ